MTDEQQPRTFPAPVDWDELYPGRFLKAADLKGEKVTLRIQSVNIDELEGDKGKQIKGILAFERTDKQLALNKTNGICLREMFGRKVQDWKGKRITIFGTVVRALGEDKDAIRIWGSPDIAADREISVVLPRKRPVKMTMHKTAPKGAQQQSASATTETVSGATAAPSVSDALAKVREAKTLEALAQARKTIWGLYAAAKEEVPMPVEGAMTDRRAALEAEAEQ